jgi:hypothetical protein
LAAIDLLDAQRHALELHRFAPLFLITITSGLLAGAFSSAGENWPFLHGELQGGVLRQRDLAGADDECGCQHGRAVIVQCCIVLS